MFTSCPSFEGRKEAKAKRSVILRTNSTLYHLLSQQPFLTIHYCILSMIVCHHPMNFLVHKFSPSVRVCNILIIQLNSVYFYMPKKHKQHHFYLEEVVYSVPSMILLWEERNEHIIPSLCLLLWPYRILLLQIQQRIFLYNFNITFVYFEHIYTKNNVRFFVVDSDSHFHYLKSIANYMASFGFRYFILSAFFYAFSDWDIGIGLNKWWSRVANFYLLAIKRGRILCLNWSLDFWIGEQQRR